MTTNHEKSRKKNMLSANKHSWQSDFVLYYVCLWASEMYVEWEVVGLYYVYVHRVHEKTVPLYTLP